MLLKILFAPIEPIILHPELALLVAAGFAVLAVVSVLHAGVFRPVPHFCILLATLGWTLFGLNEFRAQAAGWNIRVDLLVSWPLLFVISAVAAGLGIQELGGWNADEKPTAKS